MRTYVIELGGARYAGCDYVTVEAECPEEALSKFREHVAELQENEKRAFPFRQWNAAEPEPTFRTFLSGTHLT